MSCPLLHTIGHQQTEILTRSAKHFMLSNATNTQDHLMSHQASRHILSTIVICQGRGRCRDYPVNGRAFHRGLPFGWSHLASTAGSWGFHSPFTTCNPSSLGAHLGMILTSLLPRILKLTIQHIELLIDTSIRIFTARRQGQLHIYQKGVEAPTLLFL
ncbi:MAG: hypothetical protein FRX49_01653 [Trebouxia sp. A1-2]|nr:MAG: hypothetical protein FRX49_01653 [Trebouxia sp. A1-2]